jgi:hypothetical protein
MLCELLHYRLVRGVARGSLSWGRQGKFERISERVLDF